MADRARWPEAARADEMCAGRVTPRRSRVRFVLQQRRQAWPIGAILHAIWPKVKHSSGDRLTVPVILSEALRCVILSVAKDLKIRNSSFLEILRRLRGSG